MWGSGFDLNPTAVLDVVDGGADFGKINPALAEHETGVFGVELADSSFEHPDLFINIVSLVGGVADIVIDLDSGRVDAVEDGEIFLSAEVIFETENDSGFLSARGDFFEEIDGTIDAGGIFAEVPVEELSDEQDFYVKGLHDGDGIEQPDGGTRLAFEAEVVEFGHGEGGDFELIFFGGSEVRLLDGRLAEPHAVGRTAHVHLDAVEADFFCEREAGRVGFSERPLAGADFKAAVFRSSEQRGQIGAEEESGGAASLEHLSAGHIRGGNRF